MSEADLLTTLALLHGVATRSQPARQAWHRARAIDGASLALERDPSQLDALQLQAELGSPPSADRVRPALRGREQSWVAWAFLANALGHDRRTDAERHEALARAAALAPNEPVVLLAQGRDSLAAQRWEEAAGLFHRGLALGPDEPDFPRGFLAAVAHHPGCGGTARGVLDRARNGGTSNQDWIAGARTVEACWTQANGKGGP